MHHEAGSQLTVSHLLETLLKIAIVYRAPPTLRCTAIQEMCI